MKASITYKSWKKLTKNYFEPEEMLSADGMRLFNRGILVIDVEFLKFYVAFREHIGLPFLVNYGGETLRGWRSGRENQSGNRKNRPFHPMGVAMDTTVKGMKSVDVADEARKFGFYGVGLYNTFTHLDRRPTIDECIYYFWDKRVTR